MSKAIQLIFPFLSNFYVFNEKISGKLFGVFAVLEDISALLGAAIFNSAFPIIRATFSGGLFIASAIALVPLLIGIPLVKIKIDDKNDASNIKEEIKL